MPTTDHPIHDHCGVCGGEIRMQIFRNTGFCSQACQKKKAEARTILEMEAELMGDLTGEQDR